MTTTSVETTAAQPAVRTERVTLAKAITLGLRSALDHDPSVLLMGEDIGKLGGVFRVTEGLQAEFGEGLARRVEHHRAPHLGHGAAARVARTTDVWRRGGSPRRQGKGGGRGHPGEYTIEQIIEQCSNPPPSTRSRRR